MKKNSASKKMNKFRSSPLMIAVAIIEVIVLICVSTYAWFAVSDRNTITTQFIKVEPDSGLSIDFNDTTDGAVNINQYIHDFTFEPVTSLDGRNIFVPTTGSKDNIQTNKMRFREATVNDMNSKYINIDFTLTNTGDKTMPVWLNSQSYFNVDNDSREGKALRLALYSNDGSSGQVTSEMLDGSNAGTVPGEGEGDDPSQGDGNQGGKYTVYLDAPSDWTEKDQIKAHVWGDSDVGSLTGFPGETMTYDSATGYYTYSADYKYYKILFSYKGNQNQTVNLDVYDGGVYVLEEGRNGTWALEHITLNGGTKVEGGGSGSGEGNNPTDTPTTGSSDYVTVYFYNNRGWSNPHAFIYKEKGDVDEVPDGCSWPGVKLTHIAGDLYYHTFDKKYDYITFNDGKGASTKPREQTIDAKVEAGKIYYPIEDGKTTTNQITYYPVLTEDYLSSYDGGTYPVISPGTSAGFKRPYAPVLNINNDTGVAGTVIPAFASSIEEYSYGSEKVLFNIGSKQTINLSMIIWLEGTDPDCDNRYIGKDIDLKLIFATEDYPEELITYTFLDRTKERWLHDNSISETGVPYKPVIQLYDHGEKTGATETADNKGYLMREVKDSDGNVIAYTVKAPKSIADHEISFRRVNQLDETEIWNYWDAGKVSEYAYNTAGDTITFSAFADGAPTTTNSGAPSKSCGGLWGEYDNQILTMYDGTEGQWIQNSPDVSVMTIKYTLNGQTVEYKASGSETGMYYFSVPTSIYTIKPSIELKRYYGHNDAYSFNSPMNTGVKYDKNHIWKVGQPTGNYVQLNGNNSDQYYWGTDILYIQAKEPVKDLMKWVQVKFYYGTKAFYSHIYSNDDYKASSGGYGYACVIPNNEQYTNFCVQLCNPDKSSEIYNESPPQLLEHSTSGEFSHINTVASNIRTIEHLYLTVYLEMSTDYCNQDWDPEIYVWNNSTNQIEKEWPGNTMTFDGDLTGYKRYRYEVNISKYDRIKFSNDYDYGANRRESNNFTVGAATDLNGKLYKWDASGSKENGRLTDAPERETLKVNTYNETKWD